ncbi:hypothetical protein MMC12_004520 [Toensbergia leucococca]|nr:hypothetical protein [Toensbergia leucococca]
MSTQITVNDLLERNKELATKHKPIPFLSEMSAIGMTTPQILIITCADPRSVPETFLGLQLCDCGATHFKDAQILAKLKERCPDSKDIDSMTFGMINDLEQSVKDDLAILKGSPFIRKELASRSRGFIYDLKTGLLSRVEE